MRHSEDLEYLTSCRFSPTCKFNIMGDNSSERQAQLMNPVFILHHSDNININAHIPESSTIFHYIRSVQFVNCLPPWDLIQNTPGLPPVVSFKIMVLEHMELLWPIFDILVENTRGQGQGRVIVDQAWVC